MPACIRAIGSILNVAIMGENRIVMAYPTSTYAVAAIKCPVETAKKMIKGEFPQFHVGDIAERDRARENRLRARNGLPFLEG